MYIGISALTRQKMFAKLDLNIPVLWHRLNEAAAAALMGG